MADKFCQWLNQIHPRTEEETIVIKYGMELFLDNVVKTFFILLLGLIIGKGKETGCILLVFCLLRSQAGGVHAKSSLFCFIGMMSVWIIALAAGEVLYLSEWAVVCMCVWCFIMIMRYCPCTKNIDCYTHKDKLRKKLYAILIMAVYTIFAIKMPYVRTFIMVAACLESLSLLNGGQVSR